MQSRDQLNCISSGQKKNGIYVNFSLLLSDIIFAVINVHNNSNWIDFIKKYQSNMKLQRNSDFTRSFLLSIFAFDAWKCTF